MPERFRLRTDWLLLAGFCGFLFFFGLAYFGLVGADEPRYAQVAREMLARHDWITPVLGGKPWLEKPILYYWQAMLAYSVFGVSDWAARLPSAIDATLMVVAAYLFLKRFRPGSQADGALMVASIAAVIGFARAASTDMPLAAMFAIAMLCWYAWFEKVENKTESKTESKNQGKTENKENIYLAGFYAFLALAALAKGPVAPFLAAAIIVAFALARRELRWIKQTLWIPGILLFLAVSLPWYVAVQLHNPQFLRVFILEHNLERFGTNMYHHVQPFWYFIPVALVGLLPWSVLAIAAIVAAFKATGKKFELRDANSFQGFLLLWLLLPIAFFSLSHSKLPGYILPALPAGALLLSEYVRLRLAAKTSPNRLLIVTHSIVAASIMLPALMIQYIVVQHRLPWGTAAEISIGFAAILALGIGLTLASKAGLSAVRFVTLVPVVLAVGALLRIGAPGIDANLSARPLAEDLTRVDHGALPLAVFHASRETEYGLHFYRNENVSRYERGEIPPQEHLLVAPITAESKIPAQLPGRRVSHLGTDQPQQLDYYWVSASQATAPPH